MRLVSRKLKKINVTYNGKNNVIIIDIIILLGR